MKLTRTFLQLKNDAAATENVSSTYHLLRESNAIHHGLDFVSRWRSKLKKVEAKLI